MSTRGIRAAAVAALVVLGTVLGTGCISDDGDEWDGTIRVGWLTGDLHHLAFFIASDADVGGGTSFFEQNDVKVRDAQEGGYANGVVEMDSFGAGEVNVGYLGSPPAIIKHINGDIRTRVVANVNFIGSAIVAKEGIDTPADLVGKTVLTPGVGTIQHFLLLKYLDDNNVSLSEVEIEAGVAPNLMLQRMEAEKADAFIAWEPFAEDAVVAGTGKILAYSREIWDEHICCVVAAHQDFLRDHRDEVVKFLRAHKAATEWINTALADNTSADYETLVDIAEEFTQRSEETVELALENMVYEWRITQAFEEFFTAYVEELIRQEQIEQPDMEDRGYSTAADVTAKYIDKTLLSDL